MLNLLRPSIRNRLPHHQQQCFIFRSVKQLPPADISEAVAVEASAPQDVGSLFPSNGQVVDIPFPRGVDEIEDVVEDQIFDALVPQIVEEKFVAVASTTCYPPMRRFLMKSLMKLARSWP